MSAHLQTGAEESNGRTLRPPRSFLQSRFGLFQDEIQRVDDAADAEKEHGQSYVDPEILRDLALVQIDGQRWDEQCDDNFNNLIIHVILLLLKSVKGKPLAQLIIQYLSAFLSTHFHTNQQDPPHPPRGAQHNWSADSAKADNRSASLLFVMELAADASNLESV
jgi:hypothetical protein